MLAIRPSSDGAVDLAYASGRVDASLKVGL